MPSSNHSAGLVLDIDTAHPPPGALPPREGRACKVSLERMETVAERLQTVKEGGHVHLGVGLDRIVVPRLVCFRARRPARRLDEGVVRAGNPLITVRRKKDLAGRDLRLDLGEVRWRVARVPRFVPLLRDVGA